MAFLVLGALLVPVWLAGAFFFMLEAWGLRGMEKPWWMGLAASGAWFGWIVPLGLFAWGIASCRRPR